MTMLEIKRIQRLRAGKFTITPTALRPAHRSGAVAPPSAEGAIQAKPSRKFGRPWWLHRVKERARDLGLALALGTAAVLAPCVHGQAAFAQAVTPSQGAMPDTKGLLLAVLPMESVDAAPAQASAATDRFQEELIGAGTYTSVDRARIDQVFSDQGLPRTGCASNECAIRVGKLLGAKRVVTSKLTRLDDNHWLASATLLDVDSTATLRSGSVQYQGLFFDFLRQGTGQLAIRIAEPRSASQPPAVLTPVVSSAEKPDDAQLSMPSGPKPGFALYSGLMEVSGVLHAKGLGTQKFSGGGIPNLGLEYQWVPSAPITVSVYFVVGGGHLAGDLTPYFDTVTTSEIGLEGRYWQGRNYVGARLASYSAGLFDDQSRGNDTFFMDGTSIGVSGGHEWDKGWFVNGAVDYATGSGKQVLVRPNAQTAYQPLRGSFESTTLWINGGYRWK